MQFLKTRPEDTGQPSWETLLIWFFAFYVRNLWFGILFYFCFGGGWLLTVDAILSMMFLGGVNLISTIAEWGSMNLVYWCLYIDCLPILACLSIQPFSYTMCVIPIGICYLASDVLFKSGETQRRFRMFCIFLLLPLINQLGFGVLVSACLQFVPLILCLISAGVKLYLTTNQYIDRKVYMPVAFQQNVVTYTVMQLVLGALATLDLGLLIQDPLDYIRQIFAHLQGAVLRPYYFIVDCFNKYVSNDDNARAYANATWQDKSGFFGFLWSKKGVLKVTSEVDKKRLTAQALRFAEQYRGYVCDSNESEAVQMPAEGQGLLI